MTTLIISQKGWVVLPAEIRRRYGLTPGKKVQVVDYGGVIGIVPLLDDPVRQAYGLLAGTLPLTEALLAEHKEELERDERKAALLYPR
jgi:AbrB family looped-hinge helix DNA binding protein